MISPSVKQKLEEAIQTMREAVEEAERKLKRTTSTNAEGATDILHCFSWSWANASNSIQAAILRGENETIRGIQPVEPK